MLKALVVYHTQTKNTEKLAKVVKKGLEEAGVKVVFKKAYKAGLRDLLSCAGYCFASPDYFSYMAGALKDFFDRTCYPTEGKITGRPYVCIVSHGGDGRAVKSLLKMGRRFRLRLAAKPLLVEGRPRKSDLERAIQLGRKLARVIKKDEYSV